MPLRFSCPCGQKVKTPDGSAGRKAHCPACNRRLLIPQSDSYATVAQQVEMPPPPPNPTDSGVVPASPGTAVPPSQAISTAGSKGLVLVVDSDTVELAKTVEMLREHGYAVLEATDGSQGLELIRQHRPGAAVVDIRLNGISGFQLIQQLRNLSNSANKEVWDTPVIVTAVRLSGRDKQYALSIGAEAFLVKPLSPAALCPKVEKSVAKHHSH